jgi:Uma2 family endonuclease
VPSARDKSNLSKYLTNAWPSRYPSFVSAADGKPATLEDFLAIPDGERFHELIDGEIIRKASPSGEHGNAQGGVVGALRGPFQRGPGRGGPGGWWIFTEVEVRPASGDIVRPDISGWRRERVPNRPTGFPIEHRPSWVCEVVSPAKPGHDRVTKVRLYHREHIEHYWIVDPRDESLSVMRWSADGYITVLVAGRGEKVRPEPFEAIELEVGTLFGDDPTD